MLCGVCTKCTVVMFVLSNTLEGRGGGGGVGGSQWKIKQKLECCLATRTGGRLSLRGRGLPWHLCCIEGKGKRLLMMCCSDWDPRILVVDIKGQKPSGTLLLCGVLLIMLELFGTRKIQKRLTRKSIHVKHGRCLVCSHHLSWKWCVVGVVFRLLKSSF